MRVLASLSTVAVTAVVLASCGLEMGGLADTSSDGGPTLDGTATGEGGSSGGSSGSSSGSNDGPGGPTDATTDGTGSSSGSGDSSPPVEAAAETGSTVDSSVPDTGVVETGPVETGTTCTTANGCYVIPGGWALVPLAPGISGTPPACPPGYANAPGTTLFEGPNAAGACTCGACATSGPAPTCTGAIGDFFDVRIGGTGTCGTGGMPSSNANNPPGACLTDMYTGQGLGAPSYKTLDLKYVPANTLTGGQCASKGTVGTVTYAAQDRSCAPDNGQSGGCSGNQCTPGFPSPFKVCVFKNGSQSCPGAPFTDQHIAGTGVNGYSCTDCGCSITGTCTGGTMKLFTDPKCKNGELDVPADGTCVNPNAQSDNYGSYQYVANAPTGFGCQSSGTSSVQGGLQLAGVQTICCAP